MDVTRAIRRIHLRSAHCEEDSAQLAAEIAELLECLPSVDRRAVIRHAYWRMPHVPTTALQMAVGGSTALRALAGRGPVIGGCVRCGRVIRAHDRDLLDEEAPSTCGGCGVAAHPPAGDAELVQPRTPAAFGWEFQATPQPWRPQADAITAHERRWAEHYPDGACA